MKTNKTVISILHTSFINDNRVKRIASTISSCGYKVHIVAWRKNNLPLSEQLGEIKVTRLDPPFNHMKRTNKWIGFIQFISFALKAIHQYRKFDIWHCNDFEGLFIGILAKLTRPKIQLIYDSHELQSGRLGLSKFMQHSIQLFEKMAIPMTESVISVSPGIVRYYEKKHGVSVHLVRNIPERMRIVPNDIFRETFHIAKESKIFLYQGGIVPGRGIELLIEAFQKRTNLEAVLIIMGDGKLLNNLKERTKNSNNIFFHSAVPFEDIPQYTSSADVGFNMAQNNCMNHRYCLPNKIFEYIQCEIPIISNDLEDCTQLIQHYQIGTIISQYNSHELNAAIDEFLTQDYPNLKENVRKAKTLLEWENEKKTIEQIYNSIH
ncbi:MAG: hypothetical protein RLY35_2127 [Bacteroidota bacterium]|jgi:glycosyltransferase involved in cell wall biosynthesis